MSFNETSILKNTQFKMAQIWLFITSIVVIIFAFLLLHFTSSVVPVQAASIGFSSGVVSLDKYYVDNISEVKTLTVAPGDYVTVRLKYNNTGSTSATNVSINDSLPAPTFEFIPNSLKNCIINSTNCQTLGNDLFLNGNLSVAPSASHYGFASNLSNGNLEFGRLRYLHISICTQTSGNNEIYIQSIDNTSIFAPNCSVISGSSSVVNYNTEQILGNRYLHQTTCTYGNGEKEIFVQGVDNNSTFTPDCADLSGSSVTNSNTFDLLSNRYLHQTTCTYGNGEKEIFVQGVDNNSTFTPDCADLSGSSVTNSNTFDLLNTSNATGFIEYQMKSNIDEINQATNTDIGDYGTSPTLTSTDFSTLTDNMINSLSLKVYCDQISPVGGERNLSLSDAELRAGQDFRCNYEAKICPVVFEDFNTNGVKNTTEVLIPDITVLLKSADGSTTIASIVSNMTEQCFESLVHGRNYMIEINTPPTGANTTGGNTIYKLINYRTTEYDALFGYSNGSLNLNVPSSVSFPSIVVDSKPNDVQTIITPIQVIDTRLSNPGWSLTATTSDFTSATVQDALIPVSNAFKNLPGTVTVNDGQTNGISIGNLKTINSDIDSMNIFSGSAGSSKGDYQIQTTITLTVPSFSRAASYQSIYTYTII